MPTLTFAHIAALKAVDDDRVQFVDGVGFLVDGEQVAGDEDDHLDDLWVDDLIEAGDSFPDVLSHPQVVLTPTGVAALAHHRPEGDPR